MKSSFNRHTLVWIRPECRGAVAAQVTDGEMHTAVAAWLAADRPLVVARQPMPDKDFAGVGAGPACVVGALAPYNHGVPLAGAARDQEIRGHGPLLQFKPSDSIAVGLALPPAQGKRRIGLVVAMQDIVRHTPPLRLADAIIHAPAEWQPALAELEAAATRNDLELRVFGSLAWQALSGLNYMTLKSDIDLLWHPLSHMQLQQGIALLGRWEQTSGLRADGEVLFGGSSAVSWREWATLKSGDDSRVLVKRVSSAELVDARELLGMLA
jgi:phosphoribosyl-dephospho-CoA transferase